MWVRKLVSDIFTEKKNRSGRNEIIATSGRLHPSRPQNKRLYTPRTKDYRHTRQDRWIQTELAFTLAKNATKPDPVQIISLQTTRKENNWKTEETLAITVVTLETERIKLAQTLMYMMMMMMMTVSPQVYTCLFSNCEQVHRPLPPGGKPIAVNIMQYHKYTNCNRQQTKF